MRIQANLASIAALSGFLLVSASASIQGWRAIRDGDGLPFASPAPDAPEAGNPYGRSLFQLEGAWETDAGGSFRLESLRGSTQVLALFFTVCPSVCPTLVKDMKTLEAMLPEKAREKTRFVLVTIDPGHDTPAVLREYRARMGLDARRWFLLRGPPDQVQELAAVLGFDYAQDQAMDIVHANLVTVLDAGGAMAWQQAGLGEDPSRVMEAITRSAGRPAKAREDGGPAETVGGRKASGLRPGG